jgi:hypothetical protein
MVEISMMAKRKQNLGTGEEKDTVERRSWWSFVSDFHDDEDHQDKRSSAKTIAANIVAIRNFQFKGQDVAFAAH